MGHILRALDESGQADRTLVMFLSDHGMPLPFAKTQLYHHSTHTPLIFRWPGVTAPGSVDDLHRRSRQYVVDSDVAWRLTEVGSVAAGSASYADATVVTGTDYEYRVVAVDLAGNRSASVVYGPVNRPKPRMMRTP